MADKKNRGRTGGGSPSAARRKSGTGTVKKTGKGGSTRSLGSTAMKSSSGQKGTGTGRSAASARSGSVRKTAAQARRRTDEKSAVTIVKKEYIDYSLAWEIAMWVVIALSAILFISTLGLGGKLGRVFEAVSFGLFGVMAYIFPFALFLIASFFISNHASRLGKIKTLGWVLLFVTLCGLMQLILVGYNSDYILREFYEASALYRTGGGLVGGAMTLFFGSGVGVVGTYIVYVMMLIISLILITQKSLVSGMKRGSSAIARSARNGKNRSLEAFRQFWKARENALSEMGDSDTLYDPDQDEPEKAMEEEDGFSDDFSILPKGRRIENKVRGVTGATSLSPQIPERSAKADQDSAAAAAAPEPAKKAASAKEAVSVKEAASAKEAAAGDDDIFDEGFTIRGLEKKKISAGDIFLDKPDLKRTSSSGTVARTKPAGAPPKEPTQKEMLEAARKADEMMGKTASSESRESAGSQTGGAAQAPGRTESTGKKKQVSQGEIEEGIRSVAGEIAQGSTQVIREYHFPNTQLLADNRGVNNGTTEEELRETAAKLAQVFRTFGVNVKITNVTCGPSVTRYELTPEMGVKVSRIVALQDDIKLNLAVTDIRIEAPIPGKAAVGIEVPNRKPSGVYLRELLESDTFKKHKSNLAYVVGKDIGGNIIVSDIARMPHLLIAGSTGSGKSVFINTLIMSILFKAKPEDVKLIMIDPKVVELSVYNGIPHLFIPVVTDPKKAAGALNWAVAEMMARYQKFAETGVRDLKGYNARIDSLGDDVPPETKPEKLPQIVIIVDELADLMMVASSEVEDAICRLAQLARAAGIHLVIATQRPSVDVITGLIKANMPSRIAFAVSSGVDSRTILDQVGAEKLLGNGDMFFSPQTYKQPLRVQGAYVSDREVADVVAFLKEQTGDEAAQQQLAQRMEEVAKNVQAAAAGGGEDRDELFEQAGRFIIEKDKASIGMLQRWFKIGFNRAARIMDQLCDAGVVGPEEGTKPRRVEMSMEQFENYLEQN